MRYHGKIAKDINFYKIDRDQDIDTDIDDYGEIQVRSSFDQLLNFFGKLGYLLDTGIIKKDELTYFEYYLKKTIKNKAVMSLLAL